MQLQHNDAETHIQLTKTERLTLANQYKILERLDPDEADYHAQCREILENGYTSQYSQLFQNVFDEMPYDHCREVMAILDMYRCIKAAHLRLGDSSGLDSEKVSFRGFDGNEEGEHMGYAEFLIQKQKRWSESSDAPLNSHWPMLPQYRAMLSRWKESANAHELTKDDIIRILGS